jgi:hypothetical protein
VDAEGADAEILGQLPLEDGPDVVLYEHVHMSHDERRGLARRFQAAGYRTLDVEGDTLAVSGAAWTALPVLRTAWRLVEGLGAGRPAVEVPDAAEVAPGAAEVAPD